jgi:hypothetical protein
MLKNSVLFTVAAFLLLSCTSQGPVSSPKNVDYVVFYSYFNGFVPKTSEIKISSDSIVYQTKYVGGTGSLQGYQILRTEFNAFLTIIDTNKIVGMPDPVYPADSGGCSSDSIGGDYGHSMGILLHTGNIEDTIHVSSCFILKNENRSLLPDALRLLYDYKDTLCARYPKQ